MNLERMHVGYYVGSCNIGGRCWYDNEAVVDTGLRGWSVRRKGKRNGEEKKNEMRQEPAEVDEV